MRGEHIDNTEKTSEKDQRQEGKRREGRYECSEGKTTQRRSRLLH
jgi:hypothetical protein